MSGGNIAALQSAEGHKEASGEKSGFGLGHSDSIATITDGLKWFFTFYEGAIAAYNNIFEGLVSGSSLATLFGKPGNMFGIKLFEGLAEYFSGGGEDGAPQDEGGEGHDSGDYPHLNDQMGHDFSDFGGGAHHDQDYHQGQSFDPGPSPSVGGHDQGHSMGD